MFSKMTEKDTERQKGEAHFEEVSKTTEVEQQEHDTEGKDFFFLLILAFIVLL